MGGRTDERMRRRAEQGLVGAWGGGRKRVTHRHVQKYIISQSLFGQAVEPRSPVAQPAAKIEPSLMMLQVQYLTQAKLLVQDYLY